MVCTSWLGEKLQRFPLSSLQRNRNHFHLANLQQWHYCDRCCPAVLKEATFRAMPSSSSALHDEYCL
ncbi:hypothetical protein MRB53_035927 [Persea americana]|uniref:Uncharacterized protein n=1 Tax=Persea americana TaxID=3435 RepID=A0ACC2K608_PERAE|nr:hypothetical protein MRB53_035927 [Persea americana]